jgi:ABC-type multidrug transport system ATPase subunit/pSer/pThr/pTyr-binding forkhead associated (FHA) protein
MNCPNCGILLDVTGVERSTKIACPNCGERLDPARTVVSGSIGLKVDVYREGELVATKTFSAEQVTVGSSSDNDLVLEDPGRHVSRRHARLFIDEGRVYVEDLGSKNGTFVGRGAEQIPPKTRVPVPDGEQIWFGPHFSVLTKAQLGGEELGLPVTEVKTMTPGMREDVLIGRGEDCDIVLRYPQVSRRHARLTRVTGGYRLEDLGSLNGTFVEGKRVKEATVRPGDRIWIGPYEFVAGETEIEEVSFEGATRIDGIGLTRVVGDGLTILNNINLCLLPREFVGLLGASGSGKTTLLTALNGSGPPTRGAVFFNGRNLYTSFDQFRQLIGYVPQRDIIHTELPVYKILWYTAKLRLPRDTTNDDIDGRIEATLEILNLNHRRDTDFKRLSGGEQKRVNIGVELITDPTVFFLDEPTSGLDPGMESEMMSLFREIAHNQGKTVALVTHVTENIRLMDKVAVLAKGGHLAYFGPPDDAPGFFGVENFTDIYGALKRTDATDPTYWFNRYLATSQYKECIYDKLAGQEAETPPEEPEAPKRKSGGLVRQGWYLLRRYSAIITRDVRNTALLLLQAPIIAGLIALVFHGLDKVLPGAVPSTDMLEDTVVFMLVLSALWFGTNNAAKEITKEQAVYRRERMVNLRIWPYLASKVIALAFLSFIQVFLLVAIVDLLVGISGDIVSVGIAIYLAALAGTALGLLISAVVGSTDKAVALVPIVLIPQIIFAGLLRPVDDMDVVSRRVADVAVARWAYEAARAVSVGVPAESKPYELETEPPAPTAPEQTSGDAAAPVAPTAPEKTSEDAAAPAVDTEQAPVEAAAPPEKAEKLPVTSVYEPRERTYENYGRDILFTFLFAPIFLLGAALALLWRDRKGYEGR